MDKVYVVVYPILYPKETLLVLYYIDSKKKHYIQKRTH